MHKSFFGIFALIFSSFFISNVANAQQEKDYYIEFSSITTKVDIKKMAFLLKTKEEIKTFQIFRGENYFCVLKAKAPITQNDFKSWLGNINYTIVVFKQEITTAKAIQQKTIFKKLKAKRSISF